MNYVVPDYGIFGRDSQNYRPIEELQLNRSLAKQIENR